MKHQAIHNLYQASVVTDDAGIFSAFDSSGNPIQLNETDITAEVARLQAAHEANEYQRQRAAEYPPMADYLDGVVKGDQAQIDAYVAACLAVKAKYPKEQA